MTAKRRKVAHPATLPIDRSDFETFFNIDSLGYEVAKEALRQGVIRTPYEMVEMICTANKAVGRKLLDRVAAEGIDLMGEDEPVDSAKALGELLNATSARVASTRSFGSWSTRLRKSFTFRWDTRSGGSMKSKGSGPPFSSRRRTETRLPPKK